MKFREIINQFAGRAKGALGKMTPTQRLSIAMLGGTVVVSLVIFVIWNISGSGGGGWQKLFYSKLDAQNQQYVISKLGTTEFKIEDDCIMVRAKDRPRITAMFYESYASMNEPDWFEGLVEPNLIETDSQRGIKFNRARERQLSALIGHFTEVQSAKVGINKGDDVVFMRDYVKPTASVSVKLAVGVDRLNDNTVRSIATTVARYIKGLKPQEVSVVDFNGEFYRVPSKSNQNSGGYRLKVLANITEFIEDKICKVFSDIPGFNASAYVDIEWSKVEKHNIKVPAADELPTRKYKETHTSSKKDTGGAPGVTVNTEEKGGVGGSGWDVGSSRGGASGGIDTKIEKTEPVTDKISSAEELITKEPGDYVKMRVTISVPYNYLVTPYDGSDIPDDPAAKEAIMKEKIDNIKNGVRTVTKVEDLNDITVVICQPRTQQEPQEEPLTQQIWDFTRPLLGKAFVALMAFGALIFVAAFVKKNIPRPQQIPIEEIEEKIEKEVAKEKKDFLTELEQMDEGEMKAVQVKERVQDMVSENPENAANLLKTWIYKED